MSREKLEAQLFHLLQNIYFVNIDNSEADEAVEAMQTSGLLNIRD